LGWCLCKVIFIKYRIYRKLELPVPKRKIRINTHLE
jgi:hypothetical protein